MCQVGFYDFPRCIACTCNAAGIKEAGENGTSGCFPGEKVCVILKGFALINAVYPPEIYLKSNFRNLVNGLMGKWFYE